MKKVKKGDQVLQVLDTHVVVEGINRVKKHQKPNPMRGTTGGIVEKEMPIDASNVAVWNPATQKADRVGFRVLEDGRKVRFFKSNGELVNA
jgi:large subunit ribosomal protein L24